MSRIHGPAGLSARLGSTVDAETGYRQALDLYRLDRSEEAAAVRAEAAPGGAPRPR